MAGLLDIQFNHQVEITLGDQGGSALKAQVESVTADGLVLNISSFDGKANQLEPGVAVKLVYVDQTAIYSFESVIDSVISGTRGVFSIARPDHINRSQRRNFVRIDVNVPIDYCQGDEENIFLAKNFSTVTRDLSGGGVKFESEVNLPVGTILDVVLTIPGKSKVAAVGQVVRCFPLGGLRPKYSIGLEFIVIEKKDREQIIQFVFEFQRQQIKKGLV
ncbi:MAG TPA: PilZ domain-containing protein [Bacillota bacterium]|nr:PilZ domain-containing protein [Bacillota bacterium]